VEDVVDKNGNPPTHPNQRLYSKKTGKHKTQGLEQAIKIQTWPTPSVGDTEGGSQKERVERTSKGFLLRKKNPNAKHQTFGAKLTDAAEYVELVEKQTYPTPQNRDYKGKSQRANYQKDNRDCLPNIVEKPFQRLNADWVCFLMGFPIGWCDINREKPFDFFGWEKDPADCPPKIECLKRLGELKQYIYSKTHKLELNGSKDETRKEELQVLWKRTCKKKIQWEDGGFFSFFAENILQQILYESRVYETQTNKIGNIQETSKMEGEEMRDVWEYKVDWDTPQGWEYMEQFFRKLNDFVCQLSHETSLEKWQKNLEKICSMQLLQDSIWKNEMWHVPKTLLSILFS
jgi:hypothetical protein